MQKHVTERFTKITERQTYAEKEINQNIQLLSKELEKMKYELQDIIDSKFEHITRNLEMETRNLRETYDKLSSSLQVTNDNLNESFQTKVNTIKTMCATFFAKIETNCTKNNENVKNIQIAFDQFESNFVNPAKELDAKVFGMNLKISNSELTRESQFTKLSDSIRKLLYALETQ